MNISIEAVAEFLAANNADASLAPALLEHLRADESRRGQKTGDSRNIHDYLKELSTDDVFEDLSQSRSGMVSVFLNVIGDFNLSSGIRNHNWYNGECVWIVGKKKWDRRGAVGSHHYVDLRHADSEHMTSLIEQYRADGYTIVAAEITDDSVPLNTFGWPDKVVVIYGEEGAGVPQTVLDYCDHIVHIPGRGSVRSINVAACAATFLYDYSNKRGYLNG